MGFAVSEEETNLFRAFLTENMFLLDPQSYLDRWVSGGFKTDCDVTSPGISHSIARALCEEKPYSVVRIGDGEGNLITCDEFMDTPDLSRNSAEEIVRKQQHQIDLSSISLCNAGAAIRNSVLNCDILGALDNWTSKNSPDDLEMVMALFVLNPRGMSGKYRARYALLNMAKSGRLNGKTIGPAHLYVNLLLHPDLLFENARSIICMTDKPRAVQTMQTRFPNRIFDFVDLGKPAPGAAPKTPEFVDHTLAQLPQELSGVLCLVGAGPWAEIYCHELKKRGAVAVDFGSGFDVLAGQKTRPAHEALDEVFSLADWDV